MLFRISLKLIFQILSSNLCIKELSKWFSSDIFKYRSKSGVAGKMKFYKFDGSEDKFVDHFSNLSSGIHIFSEILNYVGHFISSKRSRLRAQTQTF